MGNMPLSVLVITILTLICTITYVVTMYLGLDMIPQVVEKLKPDAKENFFDGVNLKQAMVFMSILAMVLAVTHLVFSILGESSQKSCVVRPPAMLALILLTSLLQLAFIVSVGLLAMTTTLVDAVVHCEPQLGGLVQRALDPSYNACEPEEEEQPEEDSTDPPGDDKGGEKEPESSYKRKQKYMYPRRNRPAFYSNVNLLKLNPDQYYDDWMSDTNYNQSLYYGNDSSFYSEMDFQHLPPYRAALYRDMGMNLSRILRGIRKHRPRNKKPKKVIRRKGKKISFREGEDQGDGGGGGGGDDGGGGEETTTAESEEEPGEENEVNPERCYGLLVTALVMNIFIVALLTLYMIIRATNLATAICNECCVPIC